MTSYDAIAPSDFIVYAESSSSRDELYRPGSLERLPVGATSVYQTTLLPHINNPVAVEFYHTGDSTGYVYWSDLGDSYIGRVSFDGSNAVRVVDNVNSESLAVDWISGNLYWINFDIGPESRQYENFSISVSQLDGRYQKKLISEKTGKIRGIAVLPKEGYVV